MTKLKADDKKGQRLSSLLRARDESISNEIFKKYTKFVSLNLEHSFYVLFLTVTNRIIIIMKIFEIIQITSKTVC